MARPKVLISLLTESATKTEPFGRSLIDFLFRRPGLSPEYVNNFEPINNPVDNIDDVISFYLNDGNFYWRRKHPTLSAGAVIHTDRYNSGTIIFDALYSKGVDWLSVFEELIDVWGAYYGYLHILADTESASPGVPQDVFHLFQLGALPKQLASGLLELGWANYFGGDWLGKLNAESARSMGFDVIDLEKGKIVVVTDQLSDVVERYGSFSDRRKVLRSTFAEGTFRSS